MQLTEEMLKMHEAIQMLRAHGFWGLAEAMQSILDNEIKALVAEKSEAA